MLFTKKDSIEFYIIESAANLIINKMAYCPNCNASLPFLKVGFLSARRNKIKCNNCHTIIEADKSVMRFVGGFGGFVGGFLVIWHRTLFGNNPASLFMALGFVVVLFFGLAYIQYHMLVFKVAKDQNDEMFIKKKKKVVPEKPLPKNPTRIDYLKHKYQHKSEGELTAIANADRNSMTDEARQAAKELIQERNKENNGSKNE